MGKCMSRNIPKESSRASPKKSKTNVSGGTTPSQSAILWRHSSEESSARSNVNRSSSQNRPKESILTTPTFLTNSRSKSSCGAFLLQKSYSTKETVHAVGFPNNREIAEAALISCPHTYRRSSSTKEASRFSRRSFSIEELSDHSHWLYYNKTAKVSSGSKINPRILISPARRSEASDCSMPKKRLSIDAAVDCDSTVTFMRSPPQISFDDSNIDLAVGMKLSSYPSFSSLEAYDPPVSLESSPASKDTLDCTRASEKFLCDSLLTFSEPVKMKSLSEKLSLTNCNNDSIGDAITETPKDYSVCVESTAEPVLLQESLPTSSPDQHMPISLKSQSSSKKYAILQPISPARTQQGLIPVSHYSTSPDLLSSTACLSLQNQKENIHCSLLQNCRKPSSRRREGLSEKSFLNYSFSNNDVLPYASSSPEKKESHSNMLGQSCILMQAFNSTRKILEKPEKQVLHMKRVKKDLTKSSNLENGIGAGSAAELLDIQKHTTPDSLSGPGDNQDASEALGDNKDAELLGCLNSISVVDNRLYSSLDVEPIDSKAEEKDLSVKVSLPPSLSKAFSIMEAVAELSASTFPEFYEIHTKPKKDFSKVSTEISFPEAPENSISANEAITLQLCARQNEISLSDANQTSRNTDLEQQSSLNSIFFPDVVEFLERKPRSVKEMALRFASMANLDLGNYTSLETDVPPVVLETIPEISYTYAANCYQESIKSVPRLVELISTSSLDDVSISNLKPHSSSSHTNPTSPIISSMLNQSLESIQLRAGVADSINVKAPSAREQDDLKSRLGTPRHNVPVEIIAKESHEASSDDSSRPCMCSKTISVHASKPIPLPHEEQKAVSVADFEGNILSERSADEKDTGSERIPFQSNFTFVSKNSSSITSATPKMRAGASNLPSTTQASSITLSGEEIAEIWRAFEAGQTISFE